MEQNIDHIISKVLAGEATPDEKQILRDWVDSDKANLEQFNNLKAYWNLEVKLDHNVSFDNSYRLYRKHKQDNISRKYIYMLVGSAAAIAIAGLLVFKTIKNPVLMTPEISSYELVTKNKKDTLLMPDSSIIVLNKYSKLLYTSQYGEKDRQVTLEGEAYFDVAKNADKPFIVDLPKSKIQVLGTKFNIKSYDSTPHITTTLISGSIKYQTQRSQIILTPNQNLTFNKKNDKIIVTKCDAEQAMLWMKGLYKYQSVTLESLVQDLSIVYDQRIYIIDHDLSETIISGTFSEKQSIDDILHIISHSIPITWKKNKNIIAISK